MAALGRSLLSSVALLDFDIFSLFMSVSVL